MMTQDSNKPMITVRLSENEMNQVLGCLNRDGKDNPFVYSISARLREEARVQLNSQPAFPVDGAIVVKGSVRVQSAETLPDGAQVISVSIPGGYEEYAKLPGALVYKDQVYGLSGWNSDRLLAYFRTDCVTAVVSHS